MSPNDMAAMYLQSLADDEAFPGGLAHREALHRLDPDYTLASLDRVDRLLDGIRGVRALDYGQFLNLKANQNFLYLLCFYVGATVARCSDQAIEWLDYEQMRRRMPGEGSLQRCFATSITCVLQKRGCFMPLLSIEDRLFGNPPTLSVLGSAQGFI